MATKKRGAAGAGKYIPKSAPETPAPIMVVTPGATAFMRAGLQHMEDRAHTYDALGGERSMAKTVALFNTLHGTNLTETQGWRFMQCLKLVRSTQGAFRADNYEDGAAYSALAGESAAKEAAEQRIAPKLMTAEEWVAQQRTEKR